MSTKGNGLIFYMVQPGDSLSRITQKPFAFWQGPAKSRVQEVLKLNPHIENPDRIYPGEILLLGSEIAGFGASSLNASDLREASAAWKRTGTDTKTIIQKNFDVLEWLANVKDAGEFLDKLGEQSRPVFDAMQEYSMSGVISRDVLRLSTRLREMLVVRKDTIYLLQRLQISVVREPILIIQYSRNGLYPVSQALTKMINFAEGIKLGKKLTYFEIGLEGIKTVRTAIQTGSASETAKQAGRGTAKVLAGAAGGRIGKEICKVTVRRGPAGFIVCGVAMAFGVFGGAKVGDKASELLFGVPSERELPHLP